MRTLLLASLLASLSVLAACRSAPERGLRGPRLVHCVYLTLKEDTPQARQDLVTDCYRHLLPIDGIEYLAAGERDESLARPLSDLDFDVSLTLVFRDRLAYELYLPDARHLAFLAAHRDNLSGIRVFDSLEGPGTR